MRKTAILMCVTLLGAAPPPHNASSSVDAKLRAIVAPVSAAQLKQYDQTLVNFGTRHTLSSQTDPKRGIGAALNWALSEFKSDGLETIRPCDTFSGDRIPTPTRVCDAVAIQRGTERPNDVVIITAHIDSRVSDPMNANAFEPGANDDGSGSSAVLEAARVLSKHKFPGTIVYSLDSGEEQGLYGAKVISAYAKAQGWNVITDLNNDIIGNTCGSDGVCDSTHARVLSEGPRSQDQVALMAATHSLGGENDAPSRNISRFLASLADRLHIGLTVRQIWRTDRFGRGGDHIPFLQLGFPAARITVAVENYNWQHQDVRVENGVHYGDTIDHVDFPYLAKMTKLNVGALAAIASAPPPPAPNVEGGVSTDTTVTWDAVPGAAAYMIRWRRTDSNQWQEARRIPEKGMALTSCEPAGRCSDQALQLMKRKAVLPHIRIDDWVFGVASVSRDGFESPVASAVPGGAFRPYVAPPAKPRQ
ncbi:MAG TPA: M28 family peptidase [Sphingomicrobium sp.]|nr:M28 family peptidase [Sphingomicrobium sp.]